MYVACLYIKFFLANHTHTDSYIVRSCDLRNGSLQCMCIEKSIYTVHTLLNLACVSKVLEGGL